MEANRYSPDNVLLHDLPSRRRNKLHLTSPSGLAVVSEVVAVFGAVVAVGVVHRGHLAIFVPVSAEQECQRLAPVPPVALLITAAIVSTSDISGVGVGRSTAETIRRYCRDYPPELIVQLVLIRSHSGDRSHLNDFPVLVRVAHMLGTSDPASALSCGVQSGRHGFPKPYSGPPRLELSPAERCPNAGASRYYHARLQIYLESAAIGSHICERLHSQCF